MIGFILQLMRRDVTRGVTGTILLKVGSSVLAFALFTLAARTMSHEAFGVFAAWLCVAQIGSVVGLLGQEVLVVRFLSEYQVQGKDDLAKGVLLFSLKACAIAMFVATAAILAVSGIRGDSGFLMLAVALFMVVNAALMLGSQIARQLVGILMGEGNREFFWRVAVVALLAGLVFGKIQLNPAELLTIMAVAMSAGLVAQVVSIMTALPGIGKVSARYETRRWTASGLHFWFASILEAANQYFDVILIYLMLDATTAGIYFAASRLANMFAMLSGALYGFAARRLPSLYFSKNHRELEHTLTLMAEVTALCVAVGLVGIWFGAPYLLGLFGAAFAAQHWILIVLAAGTAFQAAGGPAAAMLQLTGHERDYVPVAAANVVLRLVGFLIFIPWLGVLGAAVSASLSLAIATIALNVLCRRRTGVDPSILVLFRSSLWKARARAVPVGDPKP